MKAVLLAKDGATFSQNLSAMFSGFRSDITCEVAPDGLSCTVYRITTCLTPCGSNNQIKIGVYVPAAGAICRKSVKYETEPGIARSTTRWYEVPYVGSTDKTPLTADEDRFDDNKVYMSEHTIYSLPSSVFSASFAVNFYEASNGSITDTLCHPAAVKKVVNEPNEQEYNVWFVVGTPRDLSEYQSIDSVAITGPENWWETDDLEHFLTVTSGNAAVVYAYGSEYSNGDRELSISLEASDTNYFGRSVVVTYNGTPLKVDLSSNHFSLRATLETSPLPRTPVAVTNITVGDKTYDGTTIALASGTLEGAASGDDVQLDFSYVTAEFADKNVGTNIAVHAAGSITLKGSDANKYALTTQPNWTDLHLTANITHAYAVLADTTILAQTIRVGEGSSFRHPSFTGVGGETVTDMVSSYTYEINADTHVYSIAADAIPTLLNRLSVGDTARICYTLVNSGNYKPPYTDGTITVTMRARSGSTSSGSASYAVYVAETSNGSVTASPKNASTGDTVTITIKPDSGYTLETLTVTDADGNELALTDLGNGRYSFTMPASRVEDKATFMEDNSLLNLFYDVPNDAYYYEAVKWAVEQGVTTDIGNNLFEPDQPCTRAQIVTFLWRAAGSPEPANAGSFSDVPSDSYYAKAVAWAIENGVTTGVGDDRFAPGDTCTRAQAVTLLARALNAKAEGSVAFSDVPADSYYADAVAWAAANSITEGIGGGLFGPADDCTRAQIVTFLYRAYRK